MKILIFMLAVLLSSSSLNAADGGSERTILATVDYALSATEIEHYQGEAMAGSAEAASKLMNYYRFEKKDAKKSNSWAIIGAENGAAESQFRMYQLLGVSSDLLKQRRSLFWLQKSAEGGYVGAREVFETCGSLTSKHGDRQHSPCFGPGSQE